MPFGLYTESAVATSNTTNAALDSMTRWILSPARSATDNAVFAAVAATWSMGLMCTINSKVDGTVMRSLNRIQYCRNRPQLVPRDWMSPVRRLAKHKGTMMYQAITSMEI